MWGEKEEEEMKGGKADGVVGGGGVYFDKIEVKF